MSHGEFREMLSVVDFESPSVISQAVLVAVGLGMSWRGLHLSGDKGRLRFLWGGLSLASFLTALFVAAWSNHDSMRAVEQAKQDRQSEINDIQTTLTDISGQNTKLMAAISSIAGAANVNPDQPPQTVTEEIVNKLSSLQKEIDRTNSHVAALENPPPDPDTLYQNHKPVGEVVRGHIYPQQDIVMFDEVDNSANVNFGSPVYFRKWVLSCPPIPYLFMMGISPITHRQANSVIVNWACRITGTQQASEKSP